MLRPQPTSRTSPLGTLYICHQISLRPISSNWPHSNRVPDTVWLPIDGAKNLYDICENNSRDRRYNYYLLYFSHIYVAKYLTKNDNTIWLCIKNWCRTLVTAPDSNDKLEGVEIESTACVEEQRSSFSYSRLPTFKLKSNLGHNLESYPNNTMCHSC